MDWLREFYLLFLLYPIGSETVFYRCFKEYFSLKISKTFTRKLPQFYYRLQIKGNAQFVQTLTSEPLIDFK